MAAGIGVNERLRQLPSVDRLLSDDAVQHLIATYGHHQTVNGLRETLDAVRDEVRRGADVPGAVEIATRADVYLQKRFAPTLRSVVNATGVIVRHAGCHGDGWPGLLHIGVRSAGGATWAPHGAR